jgi:Ca2+-binding RTX toxin-like protein
VLDGGAGADTLSGGKGNDTYIVDGADTLIEAADGGIDTVRSATSHALGEHLENLTATGSAAIDLTGNGLANTLTGNVAANRLDGGAGADSLIGGAGDDTFLVDTALDVVSESLSGGLDMVLASTSYALASGADVEVLKLSGVSSRTSADLTGSDMPNELVGHAGTNTLKGQGGHDLLNAFSGIDRVYGGTGNDTLFGGAGNDKLYGEGGRDIFVFDTKPSKSSNVDRVYDYETKDDSIYLDDKIFTKLGKGSFSKPMKFKKDMFVEGKEARDAEDRIVYDRKSGALYYDKDGTGSSAQVKIATLDKNLKLTHHEFFVI